MVGVPLFADECTTQQQRVTFARMLVEVDVTKELPKSVCIEDASGRILEQKVHYECVPAQCLKCATIGHDCEKKKGTQVSKEKEGAKVTQKWVPKVTQPQPSVVAMPAGVVHNQYQDRVIDPSSNEGIVESMDGRDVRLVHDARDQRTDALPIPVWNIVTRGQKGKDAMLMEGPGVVTHLVHEARGSTFTVSPC